MIWRGEQEEGGGAVPPPDPSVDPGAASGGAVGSRIESVLDAAEQAAVSIRQDAQEWANRYMDDSRHKADEMASQRVQELSSLSDSLMSRARAVAKQSDDLINALDEARRRLVGRGGDAQPAAPAAPTAVPGPPVAQPQAQPPVTPTPQPATSPPVMPDPPVEQPAPQAPVQQPPVQQPPVQPPPVQPIQEPAPPAPQAAPGPPPGAGPMQPQAEVPPPVSAHPAVGSQNDSRVSEGARLLATQMAVAGSTRDEIAQRLHDEFGIYDSNAILDEIGL